MKSSRYIVYFTDDIDDHLLLTILLYKTPNINTKGYYDYDGFLLSVKRNQVKRLTKKLINDLINESYLSLSSFHFLGIKNVWDEIIETKTPDDRKEIFSRLEKERIYHYLEL